MGEVARGRSDDDQVKRPHAVCIPYPAQGHINPMFRLAKVLHHRGFHITYVHTEFNYRRLRRSQGMAAIVGLQNFHYESIPDGLPDSDVDATQNIAYLCHFTAATCLPHLLDLLHRLNSSSSMSPPVSCLIADTWMSFALDAAAQLSIPIALFWTQSVCSVNAFMQYPVLQQKGLIPLKDESCFTNGYLDTEIDWIPGMGNIRLGELTSFLRTTDPNDIMMNFIIREVTRQHQATAIIFNTFDDLDSGLLVHLSAVLPPIYTVGPLHLLYDKLNGGVIDQFPSSLWAEERECLHWLDGHEKNSVLYVNFGSITVLTDVQLVEFAWGLSQSETTFLWVIRPDLVSGDAAVLPPSFAEKTKERGLLTTWCPQDEVLKHPSVGAFLTHSGWNSTIESLAAGIPVLCWPFFADQDTNCAFSCQRWGIGTKIGTTVDRGEVEGKVREMMHGLKGTEVRRQAEVWKEKALRAVAHGGSSVVHLDRLVKEVFLSGSQ